MKIPVQFYITQGNVELKHSRFSGGAKKALVKIAVLALIIGLNWLGLSAVLGTAASFSDKEISQNNEFRTLYLSTPPRLKKK